MAKKTLKERFEAALRARGETDAKTTSTRFTALTFTYQIRRASDGTLIEREKPTTIWLGDSGAVRVGRTATGSLPLPKPLKDLLLEEAK